MEARRTISIDEVCDMLGVSRRAVNGWIRHGLVSVSVTGKTILSFAAWIFGGGKIFEIGDLWSVAEVARKLELDTPTISRRIKDGRLKTVRTNSGLLRILANSPYLVAAIERKRLSGVP